MMCYELDGPGFEFLQKQEMFHFSKSLYRLWGPPSIIFSGSQGPFKGMQWQCVKLSTHHHTLPKLRMSAAIYLPLPPPHMPSWHWQGQLHLSSTEVRRIDFSLNNTDRINADVGKNIRLTWIKIMLRLRRDKSVVGEFPSARCNMCVVTSVLQIVSVTPLNSPNLPLQSIPLSLYGCTFFCFVCDCPQMFALLLQITFINSQQVRALSK